MNIFLIFLLVNTLYCHKAIKKIATNVKKATGKDIVYEEKPNSSKGIISLLNIISTAGMNKTAG